MCHLISGLFAEHTTQLMLDHMVEERFASFRWAMLPLVVLAAIIAAGTAAGMVVSTDFVETYFINYNAALWLYLSLKFYFIVTEICDVLGIWCFDIVTPHPKSKRD